MTFRLTSAAYRELREALEFYERQQAGLGMRFLVVIESAIDRLPIESRRASFLAIPRFWR